MNRFSANIPNEVLTDMNKLYEYNVTIQSNC